MYYVDNPGEVRDNLRNQVKTGMIRQFSNARSKSELRKVCAG